MKSFLFTLFFSILISFSSLSQDIGYGLEVESPERLSIMILVRGNEDEKIDISKEHVRNRTELRLRQSNISITPIADYDIGDPLLVIDVASLNNSIYSVSVGFSRNTFYEVNGKAYKKRVPAWSIDGIGHYNGELSRILNHLDIYLDKFLNEYHRANKY